MSVIIARPACCTLLPAVTDTTSCVNGEFHSIVVAAGTTGTIPLAHASSIAGAKLLVSMYNDAQTLIRTFEVFVASYGSTPYCVVYGITGHRFDQVTDVDVNAGDLRVLFINNESYDVNVSVVFIPMPLADIPQQTGIVPITTNQTVIPPASSGCLDVVAGSWVGAKWSVTISDGIDRTSFQVSTNTQVANMYAVVGSTAGVQVTLLIVGSFISLVLTNNRPDAVHVIATRIPITSVQPTPTTCTDGSTSPGHIIPSQVVASAQNAVIDSVSASASGVKWLIVATDLTTYDVHAFELNADLQTCTFVQYAIIGKYQALPISLEVNGNLFDLHVINSITSPIRINILRLPISI